MYVRVRLLHVARHAKRWNLLCSKDTWLCIRALIGRFQQCFQKHLASSGSNFMAETPNVSLTAGPARMWRGFKAL